MIKRLIPIIILLICIAGCGSPDKPKDLRIHGYSLNRLIDRDAQVIGGANLQQYFAYLEQAGLTRILKMRAPSKALNSILTGMDFLKKTPVNLVFSITGKNNKMQGYMLLIGKNPFPEQLLSVFEKSLKNSKEFRFRKINNRVVMLCSDAQMEKRFQSIFGAKSKKILLPLLWKLSPNPVNDTAWASASLDNFNINTAKKMSMLPLPQKIALLANGDSSLELKGALKMKSKKDASTLKQMLEFGKMAAAQNLSRLNPQQAMGIKLLKNISLDTDGDICTLSLSIAASMLKGLVAGSGYSF